MMNLKNFVLGRLLKCLFVGGALSVGAAAKADMPPPSFPDHPTVQAFIQAVENGDVAKAMSAAAKIPKELGGINVQDKKGRTAINIAVEKSDLVMVKALLKNSAHPDGGTKNSPLPNAIRMINLVTRKFQPAIAQTLLDAGATVDAPDSNDQTALWEASLIGSLDAIRFLAQHKANIRQTRDGETLPMVASSADKWQAVELLLQLGADPNATAVNGRSLAKDIYHDHLSPKSEEGQAMARVKAKLPPYSPPISDERNVFLIKASANFMRKGLDNGRAHDLASEAWKKLKALHQIKEKQLPTLS